MFKDFIRKMQIPKKDPKAKNSTNPKTDLNQKNNIAE